MDNFNESIGLSTQEQLDIESAFNLSSQSDEIKIVDTKRSFLSTGCVKFDTILNGEIALEGLTEITGPGGIGKTQIALQLCVTCQLPKKLGGLNCGAIYISTEGPFPSKRLEQLIAHLKKMYGPNVLPENPMDNILLKTVTDTNALIFCIITEVPSIIKSNHNIKFGLLIVDSVAATFRSEFSNLPNERIKAVETLGAALLHVGCLYNLVLVAINQVRALIPSNGHDEVTPCLGNTLKNKVTTRIQLRRNGINKMMEIKFSSHIPHIETDFCYDITNNGITIPQFWSFLTFSQFKFSILNK